MAATASALGLALADSASARAGTGAVASARALDALMSDPLLAQRIVHIEKLAGRDAEFADADLELSDLTLGALGRCGIDRLYAHQAEAINAVMSGRSVVVATGTASGKSLSYLVPIFERCTPAGGSTTPATALLLFPTKALARDQLRALRRFGMPGIEAAAIDGDTPPEERDWARKHANVIFTNPDMLHRSLLPNHHRWNGFFKRIGIVVVDETHTLRGVFGSHVAHLLRRLRRVAADHGTAPVTVCTSATLGNPVEMAERISGSAVVGIETDSAPTAPRTVVCWNPPLIDPEAGRRMSPMGEAGRLLARFVGAGLQTLAFCSSRKGAEMIARIARDAAESDIGDGRIVTYRGGYLPEERREIEERLASGAVRGVAATSALELGMDISGLDAVICTGFPGTVASFRQQIGRAGRGSAPALAVLVAGADQLDQWYLANPHELFQRPAEKAVVNVENLHVREPHLACAAYELALRPDEPALGADMEVRAAPLLARKLLRMRRGRLHWAGGGSPARDIDIRAGGGDTFRILDFDTERDIGTVDAGRVFTSVHPGAVYMHQGETYVVEDLDLDLRVAYVARLDADYYTQPRTETDIAITNIDNHAELGESGVVVSLGGVEVTKQVTGFRRRLFDVDETINSEVLDLPAQHLETRAFWYAIPDDLLDACELGDADVPGVVHACEHTGIGILPRFAICDRWDVGGVSMPMHPDTGTATWFIYDGFTGGAGIAEAGFGTGVDHVRAAHDVIDACGCSSGCPSCVQSPKCGNWNEPLDKDGSRRLLAAILAAT